MTFTTIAATLAVATASVEWATCPPTGFNCRVGRLSNTECSATTTNAGLADAIKKDAALPSKGNRYICGTPIKADTYWFNKDSVFVAKGDDVTALSAKFCAEKSYSVAYKLGNDGTVDQCVTLAGGKKITVSKKDKKEKKDKESDDSTTTSSPSTTSPEESTDGSESTETPMSSTANSTGKKDKKHKASSAVAVGAVAALFAAAF